MPGIYNPPHTGHTGHAMDLDVDEDMANTGSTTTRNTTTTTSPYPSSHIPTMQQQQHHDQSQSQSQQEFEASPQPSTAPTATTTTEYYCSEYPSSMSLDEEFGLYIDNDMVVAQLHMILLMLEEGMVAPAEMHQREVEMEMRAEEAIAQERAHAQQSALHLKHHIQRSSMVREHLRQSIDNLQQHYQREALTAIATSTSYGQLCATFTHYVPSVPLIAAHTLHGVPAHTYSLVPTPPENMFPFAQQQYDNAVQVLAHIQTYAILHNWHQLNTKEQE